MYVPLPYRVTDSDAWDLVESVGSGFLVVASSAGLCSVFAPLLVVGSGERIHAHVSRANPWWSSASDGDQVSVLVRAADTYVSPTLYPGRMDDPRVAPTWDYYVVEVLGTVTIRDDAAFVESVVRRLTEKHESSRATRWSVDDAPEEFTAALVRAIVGIDIAVNNITGAAKLSQTKSETDRAFVYGTLSAGNERERAVAARMDAHS